MAVERVPAEQVEARLRRDNPWWVASGGVQGEIVEWEPRAYFALFLPLVTDVRAKRAVVLMGPRRVGKTVMLHHAIQHLLETGTPRANICYVSLDTPVYHGQGLEDLLGFYVEAAKPAQGEPQYVFFDEVQYLADWEVHLKSLVDSYRGVKFVVSGSAAAVLRRKSVESGAGRFTDFLLPPLTFHEFANFVGCDSLLEEKDHDGGVTQFACAAMDELNDCFVDYLNFGAYPELVAQAHMREDVARHVKGDIIDKVLLKDLPSLYGISDVAELNSFFSMLAYNTAQELSFESLSRASGVSKNTIRRYLEYLEGAYLIQRLDRIDRSAKHFQRARSFKVYLTNPSMWAALFTPVDADSEFMGRLVETAVLAQWFHRPTNMYYANWTQGRDKGEVDLVHLHPDQKPWYATEVKWSDRPFFRPAAELKSLLAFCAANKLKSARVTTRSLGGEKTVQGIRLRFFPAALHCYFVAFNLLGEAGRGRTEL